VCAGTLARACAQLNANCYMAAMCFLKNHECTDKMCTGALRILCRYTHMQNMQLRHIVWRINYRLGQGTKNNRHSSVDFHRQDHDSTLASGYRIIFRSTKKAWKYAVCEDKCAKNNGHDWDRRHETRMLDILNARTGDLPGRGHSVDTVHQLPDCVQ